MGNRATIIFENKKRTEFSSAIYLHWNGGPESVYAFLDELDRRKVRADQNYEAARFIQIVSEFFDQETYSGLSLGVSNGPSYKEVTLGKLAHFCPGDNGIFFVNRNGKRRIRRAIVNWETREAQWFTNEQIELEKKIAYKHEYRKGENPIQNSWDMGKPIEGM